MPATTRSQTRNNQAHVNDKEPITPPRLPGSYPDISDELNRRLSVYVRQREEGQHDISPISATEFAAWVNEDPNRVYDVVCRIFRDDINNYRAALAQHERETLELRQQLNTAMDEAEQNKNLVRERNAEIAALHAHLREASVATNITSATTVSHVKPLEYKHTKFNGQAKNLRRFINRLENDFALFAANFPTEETKVAYAMSGLDEQPDEWAQQFYENGSDGARHSWAVFKAKLKENYKDPNLIANTQRKLFELKQGKNLTDFINTFENLCARVNWPRSAWASTFINGLQAGLQRKIRESNIDINNYSALKNKAIRLQAEYERASKTRPAINRRTEQLPRKPSDSRPLTNFTQGIDKRTCYHCGKEGHISVYCPDKREKQSTELKMLKKPNTEALN
ncbi:Phosphoglucomutase-3 [Ascosphaera pollenicola]|nr:Phosphoglucomutase-3 [Ascosphaera pollenicola]